MKLSIIHRINIDKLFLFLHPYLFLLTAVYCFDNSNVFSSRCVNSLSSLAVSGYGRELRLHPNGQFRSAGMVELFSDASQDFIPLCYPGLSSTAAHVVCHHLGFTTALHTYHIENPFISKGLQFYITCHGSELSFDECWIANRSLDEHCPYLIGIKCSACVHEVTVSSGVISSPGFPEFYPHAIECEWTLIIPNYYELFIEILTFDLPYSKVNDSCINGYLELGYIIHKGQHRLARYCGQHIRNPFISESSITWIRFYSGWPTGNHYPLGFNLTFERRKLDYGNATAAQILLAAGFGIFLLVVIMSCIYCYWKQTCKTTKHKESASRKENVVKLVEQYVNTSQ